MSKLTPADLALNQVLYNQEESMTECYFVNSGLVSIVSVQRDGKSVEVGLIGNEGFVGLPLVVGYTTAPIRMVVQAGGTAYRCPSETLRSLLRQYPVLEIQLHRYRNKRIVTLLAKLRSRLPTVGNWNGKEIATAVVVPLIIGLGTALFGWLTP